MKRVNLHIVLFTFFLTSCSDPIERSGVVIDATTHYPIEGASIEIYLKEQTKDSLQNKVFTDEKGCFSISEKKDSELLFSINKDGYKGFVGTLSNANDTVLLEPFSE